MPASRTKRSLNYLASRLTRRSRAQPRYRISSDRRRQLLGRLSAKNGRCPLGVPLARIAREARLFEADRSPDELAAACQTAWDGVRSRAHQRVHQPLDKQSVSTRPTTATASRPVLGIVDLRDRFTSHKGGQAPPRQWGLCLRDPFRCPLIASTYVSFTSTGGRRIADASVVDLIVPPNPSTFVHLAGRVRRHARTPPNELARLRPLHTDEPVAFDNDSECAIAVLASDAKTSPPNQDVCRRSWQAHAASAHRATSLVANATSLRHSPLASC